MSSFAPADNAPGLAWSALILPFVEQAPLWDRLKTATNGGTVNWQSAPGGNVGDQAEAQLLEVVLAPRPARRFAG